MMLDDLRRRLGWLVAIVLAVLAAAVWLLAGCSIGHDLRLGMTEAAVAGVDRAGPVLRDAVAAGVDRIAEHIGHQGEHPHDPGSWAAIWAGLAAVAYPLLIRPLRLWLATRGKSGNGVKGSQS